MRFFDSNTFIGKPTRREAWSPVDAVSLVRQMDRSGIERALVWHIAQHDAHPILGNELLTREVSPLRGRLVPCWAVPSPHTGEMGEIDPWFDSAISAGVRTVRICRTRGSYLVRPEVVGDIVQRLLGRRLPLIYSIGRGGDWNELYDLLKAFPQLRVIISDLNIWPSDRLFRPLLELYPHVKIETSEYFVPGGIESLVERYGPQRLLFGSGYPACYHGGLMLLLAHAQISDEAKAAIAGGNLRRLIDEVQS